MIGTDIENNYNINVKIVAKIGRPNLRFHDLRHSYAVASIQSGDDNKTLQENLGHETAAFTLNTYAHVTSSMNRASANRMQAYIANLWAVRGMVGGMLGIAPVTW